MEREKQVFAKAQCIWDSDSTQVNQYALFEHVFPLSEDIGNVVLRISVDNKYQLYINGKLFPEAQAYSRLG